VSFDNLLLKNNFSKLKTKRIVIITQLEVIWKKTLKLTLKPDCINLIEIVTVHAQKKKILRPVKTTANFTKQLAPFQGLGNFFSCA
jgi:hypothetical protein